jgi:hypothetical protein
MNMMLKDLPPVTRDSYSVLERQYGARNYKPFNVVLTRGVASGRIKPIPVCP